MARVDIIIPEPTPVYTEDNQRQVAQSLQTLKDKLNTSYQEELKQEIERVCWYSMRFGC